MKRVAFTIDGTPKGKARPRADFVNGRVHEDPESAKEEMRIRGIAAKAFGDGDPWTGPVRLVVTAIFEIPASWPKRYREALANGGTIYHDQKPDKDNIEKLVMDACNSLVWRDDGQVALGGILKRYGSPERMEVVAELILDESGNPPMPTPRQIAAEKVSWASVVQARADAKAARREAAKQRRAEFSAKIGGKPPFRGRAKK